MNTSSIKLLYKYTWIWFLVLFLPTVLMTPSRNAFLFTAVSVILWKFAANRVLWSICESKEWPSGWVIACIIYSVVLPGLISLIGLATYPTATFVAIFVYGFLMGIWAFLEMKIVDEGHTKFLVYFARAGYVAIFFTILTVLWSRREDMLGRLQEMFPSLAGMS